MFFFHMQYLTRSPLVLISFFRGLIISFSSHHLPPPSECVMTDSVNWGHPKKFVEPSDFMAPDSESMIILY